MASKINPKFMPYSKDEVQKLLGEVKNRSFIRDVTEDEYESLPQEEKENGDLYLLYDPDEQ